MFSNNWILYVFVPIFLFVFLYEFIRFNIENDPVFGKNVLVVRDVLQLKYSINNLAKCRAIVAEIPNLKCRYLRSNIFKRNIVYVPFRRELYIKLSTGNYVVQLDEDYKIVSSGYLLG